MREPEQHLITLIQRYPALEICRKDIEKSYTMLAESIEGEKKIIVCGNGGSAADSEHIVGELMKGFLKNRPLRGELRDELTRKDPRIGEKLARGLQAPIRALSLTSHISLSTAFNNDVDSELGFAQQLLGLGDAGDTLIAISTSGNAANVNNAVMLASVLGIGTIGLTGEGGGSLATLTDICIRVPEQETFMIQELHLPVYHALCSMLEEHFFEE